MKNIGKLATLGAVLAVSASFTATAGATIVGSAYCDIAADTGGQGSSYAILTPTISQLSAAEASSAGLCASFTSSAINFATGSDSVAAVSPGVTGGLSLNNFLNYGGDLLSSTYYALAGANGAGPTTNTGSQNDDGTLLVLDGSSYLTAGELITLSHDDGAYIYVCLASGTCDYSTGAGFSLISGLPANSGVQTTAGQTPFTYTGSTGEYDFELIYDSNYEQPSELVSNLGAAPEPSSLILLGTGLVGAAGLMYRRRQIA